MKKLIFTIQVFRCFARRFGWLWAWKNRETIIKDEVPCYIIDFEYDLNNLSLDCVEDCVSEAVSCWTD